MSSRRNRDRAKSALPKLDKLPRVSYEEVAQATFGKSEGEIVNQWFGDISPGDLAETGLELGGDGSIQAYEYRLTGMGLDPAAMPSDKSNWQQLGQLLFRFDRSIQWLIGDWLLQGEQNNWGKHEEIADEMGYAVKTLYDYRYVARNVDFSVRTENLSFGHHKLVAQLPPAEQKYWLEQASQGDFDAGTHLSRPWSINRLRKEISAPPAVAALEASPFERNLGRIDRDTTREKWILLPADERLKRYQYLRAILTRMEHWGFD